MNKPFALAHLDEVVSVRGLGRRNDCSLQLVMPRRTTNNGYMSGSRPNSNGGGKCVGRARLMLWEGTRLHLRKSIKGYNRICISGRESFSGVHAAV